MTVRIPVQGQWILLHAAVGKRPQDGLELRLFSNPVLDLGSLTASDFAELQVPGYSPRELKPELWKEEPGTFPARLVYPPQAFTFQAAAGWVRGYYVVQKETGLIVWYEPLARPVNGKRRGDRVTVTPRLTASSA